MSNPLLKNKPNQVPNNNPFSIFMNRLNDFKQFSQGFTPESAEAKVKDMISNGQMSKEQFDQLSNMAKQIQGMMGNGRR